MNKSETSKKKSIGNIIFDIIFYIIIAIVAAFIIAWLFGYEPRAVMSGSMEPAIQTGSLSFIDTNYDYDDVEVGDVVAFSIDTGESTVMVTHRVEEITDEGFVTKGDNNEHSDGVTTTRENFEGLNIFSIPILGYIAVAIGNVIAFLIFTTKGRIYLIMIAAAIVFLFFISKVIKEEKKQKLKKDTETTNANKDSIEDNIKKEENGSQEINIKSAPESQDENKKET